ncbi:MAG: FAD-binding protein [Burkholderiales bacterium]
MTASIAALETALPLLVPRTGPTFRSAQELRLVLRTASTRISAADLSQLDRVLRLDAGAGLVEAQAGVTWQSLCSYLQARAVPGADLLAQTADLAGLPGTLGDCVGRNIAAPDGSPFCLLVEALAIVTADGELRRTSRASQPELFGAAIGSHGLIGAMYSVTLRVAALTQAFVDATPPVVLDSASTQSPQDRTHARIRLQLMVPPARLEAFLCDLRRQFDDLRLPIARLSVRKALPEGETLLRWASEELALIDVAFADRGTLPSRIAATQLRRNLIGLALEHGGRFDLTTGLDASREQVESGYPMFSAFLAEKRRYDPQERLDGGLYRHYRALFRRQPCEVRWAAA